MLPLTILLNFNLLKCIKECVKLKHYFLFNTFMGKKYIYIKVFLILINYVIYIYLELYKHVYVICYIFIKDLALVSSQRGQHVMHCVAPSPNSSDSFKVGSIVAVHLSYRRLHANLEVKAQCYSLLTLRH